MRTLLKRLLSVVDWLISPLTVLSAILFRFIRRAGIDRMSVSRRIFRMVGIFPIRDHYYDPLFDPKYLTKPLSDIRTLPGIDLNIGEQLSVLSQFRYGGELEQFARKKVNDTAYHYHNESFGPGDAEYLYNMIRLHKPRRIVEIGSGNSTLMAIAAIVQNRREDPAYDCAHICVEPYEAPWLEAAGVRVIRDRVERSDIRLFTELEANDILLIDSSHVIKPQGDVLFEYLEVLPLLRSGVLVHVHDIYTPRDYPDVCIVENVRLWNEQYLLEAFLTLNDRFRIIAALNHLKHSHFDELARACPVLKSEPHREPGSFWMVRN